MDFQTLMNHYMTRHVARLRSSKKVESHVKPLRDFFGTLPLDQVTEQRINEFKWSRMGKVKPATINRSLAALHKSLALAKEWGWISTVPTVHLEKENNARDRYLTQDEEDRLLEAAPVWMQELITFFLNTGLRLSEALELRWSHVDLKRRTILIARSKNGHKRTIPLNEKAMEIIHKKMKSRVNGLIFPSVRSGKVISTFHYERAFRRAVKKAGLTDLKGHDLRHSFASRIAQRGIDLYRIQRLLGHTTPTMTQRYAHHNAESLREVVSLL